MPRGFTPEASKRGQETSRERALDRAEDRWEEIDFMLDQGISAQEIARRIGSDPNALSRQAYRYGWTLRARRFNYARKQEKRAA